MSLVVAVHAGVVDIYASMLNTTGLLTRAGRVRTHFESDTDHEDGQEKQRGADNAKDERQSSLALIVIRFDCDISDAENSTSNDPFVKIIKSRLPSIHHLTLITNIIDNN